MKVAIVVATFGCLSNGSRRDSQRIYAEVAKVKMEPTKQEGQFETDVVSKIDVAQEQEDEELSFGQKPFDLDNRADLAPVPLPLCDAPGVSRRPCKCGEATEWELLVHPNVTLHNHAKHICKTMNDACVQVHVGIPRKECVSDPTGYWRQYYRGGILRADCDSKCDRDAEHEVLSSCLRACAKHQYPDNP